MSLTGLAAALWLAGAGQIEKWLGPWAVWVAWPAIAAILLVARVISRRLVTSTDTPRVRRVMVIASVTLLLATFAVMHPLADTSVPGHGDDRDEALDLAVEDMLAGRFPYYRTTYLGGPITPLPGALLLATPFVLLGASAYQNLFWICVLLLIAQKWAGSVRQALLLFWTVLVSSPIVMRDFAAGSDLLANSIYVLMFMLLFVGQSPTAGRRKWVAAAGFGLALSSRPNWLFLLPIVFSCLAQRLGWRMAAALCAGCVMVAGAITLPFYFADPDHFSPLHVTAKFSQFDPILPHPAVWLTVAIAAIAIGLAAMRSNERLPVLLRNAAIIQAVPIIVLIALDSVRAGRPGFQFADFGLVFLFFAVLAAWRDAIGLKGPDGPRLDCESI